MENFPPEEPEIPPDRPIGSPAPKGGQKVLHVSTYLTVLFRHIRPSWRHYIDYVDIAARNGDEDMIRYRNIYAALPQKERIHHIPEEICDLAGITIHVLYGRVCQTLSEMGAIEASMIAALEQPQLVKRTFQLAQKAEHYDDRELCHRTLGILPDKKGASINIYNQPLAEAKAVALQAELRPTRLGSFDEEIIEMSRELDTPHTPYLVEEDVSPQDD